MPTSTYDLIASNVLTSSASNIEFTSIPSTYRDLVIVMTVTADSASFGRMRFNNNSGSNYNLNLYVQLLRLYHINTFYSGRNILWLAR